MPPECGCDLFALAVYLQSIYIVAARFAKSSSDNEYAVTGINPWYVSKTLYLHKRWDKHIAEVGCTRKALAPAFDRQCNNVRDGLA
jgi:hypothetical protein